MDPSRTGMCQDLNPISSPLPYSLGAKKMTGANLRRPIKVAEDCPWVRGQKFPYLEETSGTLLSPPPPLKSRYGAHFTGVTTSARMGVVYNVMIVCKIDIADLGGNVTGERGQQQYRNNDILRHVGGKRILKSPQNLREGKIGTQRKM